MAGAAGWDGCVAGRGSVRKNATSGCSDDKSVAGNSEMLNSEPGDGNDPDDPSATCFVYSCDSFLAPVSRRRAYDAISVKIDT
jgi:hypothetical protein